jgi:aminomuconate-semialdehyde/2-hydroxymuconate-6-semialdehyde dehydrogenase
VTASPKKLENFIGGRMHPPAAGDYLEDFEPATGQVHALVPESGKADLDRAIEAAAKAFPAWSGLPAGERAAVLGRIGQAILKRIPELARAETVDNGKPISLSENLDIPRAAANLEFFAAAATQFASESHVTDASTLNYTLREPHGVVGCISPWNLPLYLFTWKIAPALAAGNCVIGKPSEVTPMTAWLLSSICAEAGLPSGVLNVLHGSGTGIGQAIVEHPDIPVLSFTGGTATGERIARTAAPMFKKLSLELGGKNPSIVFEDCDRDRTLDGVLRAAYLNQGQICLCGSRILVQSSIYDSFRDELLERVRALRVGDPLDRETRQGAVVSAAHFDKVLSRIQRARQEGGEVLCGGRATTPESARCSGGWFVEPTLIQGLAPDCSTNQDEIFGPVATISAFGNEEEAVSLANGTRYGLAASIWSRDVDRCHRIARRLQAGLVWVNCWMVRDLRTPMGGMKASGVGREGGLEAMRFFTEPKNVCISISEG